MVDALLSPYGALDLTNEQGQLCGKILADLGANVIKVEPPRGDPARHIGPFYQDIPHSERSFFWWAFNTNKRGIALDIERPPGRETFKKLVATTDFVLESFPPGYMDSLGLGYEALRHINPGIIVTSITPFGQTGPYRNLKSSDIVVMALGGQMFSAGYPDRPPVRLSVPQAFLLASTHGAAASMIALHYRMRTGLGQHVDISAQAAVARLLTAEISMWEFNQEISHRAGPVRPAGGGLKVQLIWPCKDGTVTLMLGIGGFLRGIRPLVDWMASEGAAGRLKDVDWDSLSTVTTATFTPEVESWQDIFAAFLRQHTKAELYEGARLRHIPLFPTHTPGEIAQDQQLEARKFWATVEHPELGRAFAYPGAHAKFSLTPWRIQRRAPLLGEHNLEILAESEAKPRAPLPGIKPSPRPATALEGLKVLDFTWFLAGPLITKYLSDFGARVIKVESASSLDLIRTSPPFKDGIPGLNRSATFRLYNGSKLSMSLRLSNPKGQELARKLAAWADVVVENFTPDTLARWGLDYEHLRQVNPALIMLSTSNQGQTGPHSRHPGFGWNLSALGGFNHLTGWPDREGIQPNTAYTDSSTPWLAVVSVLGAVDYRRRTGHGQYIDMSQYEAGLTYLSTALLNFNINGQEQTRCGNTSARACPHAAYPCRGEDRWCVVAVYTETEWQAMVRVMGDAPWAKDSRLATFQGRKENEEELNRLIGAWTLNLSADEVMDRLQSVGVAAGVVQNVHDLVEDPQLAHWGYFQVVDHPEVGPLYHVGWPACLSLTPYHLRYAPMLGEHTDMVCRGILKMSAEELRDYQAAGAFD